MINRSYFILFDKIDHVTKNQVGGHWRVITHKSWFPPAVAKIVANVRKEVESSFAPDHCNLVEVRKL